MKLYGSVLTLLCAVVYVIAQAEPQICGEEKKECDDGTWIGKDPDNNCEWLPCPDDSSMLCIQDVNECDDGTWVGRDPDNNCEFYPCPAEGCTEEAKMCPDGSSVSRDMHNNCEFHPCPEGGVCRDWGNQDWEMCAAMAVPNMCNEDDECDGKAVCCEVECGGHDCVMPMPEPECPADISDSEVDGCDKDECDSHDDCAMMYGHDSNMACCWNGCAKRCVYGGGHSGAPKTMLASVAVILISIMTTFLM